MNIKTFVRHDLEVRDKKLSSISPSLEYTCKRASSLSSMVCRDQYHIVPNDMEDTLRSAGLKTKRSIVDQHLVEAVNKNGATVVVWSGTEDLGCEPHKKSSNIRAYANHFHDHAKNSCGLCIEHPDEGVFAYHGNNETSLAVGKLDRTSSNVRVLPLLTMSDLQNDHRAALAEADKVSSRVSGALALNVVSVSEDYNNAYIELERASKQLFEAQDNTLQAMIMKTRNLRDNIRGATSAEIDALQKNEHILETLYSHSDELRSYVTYITDVTSRLDALSKEITNFGM